MLIFVFNHVVLERQRNYTVFIMCSRDIVYLDHLQAFSYLFSFRITVSVPEEQLKWILITKQRSDVGKGKWQIM